MLISFHSFLKQLLFLSFSARVSVAYKELEACMDRRNKEPTESIPLQSLRKSTRSKRKRFSNANNP